jgi:hypothetical protein
MACFTAFGRWDISWDISWHYILGYIFGRWDISRQYILGYIFGRWDTYFVTPHAGAGSSGALQNIVSSSLARLS